MTSDAIVTQASCAETKKTIEHAMKEQARLARLNQLAILINQISSDIESNIKRGSATKI